MCLEFAYNYFPYKTQIKECSSTKGFSMALIYLILLIKFNFSLKACTSISILCYTRGKYIMVVDLAWLSDAKEAALSLPFVNWTGKRNYSENFTSQGKDREINCHHRQNQTQLGEINLVYCQPNQDRIKRNKNKSLNTFPWLFPYSWAQPHNQFLSSTVDLHDLQGNNLH